MINYNIQALRALAAYAVVSHHIIDSFKNYIAIDKFDWDINLGSFGVELFFVISGYIMIATNSSKSQSYLIFLAHRLIRVAPMYWILTLAASALMLFGFRIFGGREFSAQHLIASLLFLPYFIDGKIVAPILFVGWTLNYEMFFYLLFAMSMILKIENARAITLITVLAALIALRVIYPGNITEYIGNEIILGFGCGIIVWLLTKKTKLGRSFGFAGLAGGLIGLILIDFFHIDKMAHGSLLVSIAAAAITAGTISLEQMGISAGRGWLVHQGNASYTVYLIHPFVIQFLGKAALITHLNDTPAGLIIVATLMFALSAVSGTILHLWVEVPLSNRLRQFLGHQIANGHRRVIA